PIAAHTRSAAILLRLRPQDVVRLRRYRPRRGPLSVMSPLITVPPHRTRHRRQGEGAAHITGTRGPGSTRVPASQTELVPDGVGNQRPVWRYLMHRPMFLKP